MRPYNAKILPLLLLTALFGCGEMSDPRQDEDSDGIPPQITSFIATPSSISEVGQPVTLSWTTSGTVVDATLRPTSAGTITVIEHSNYIVYPTAETTYTLTVSNGAGAVSSTVTVTVGDNVTPPPSNPPPSAPPPTDPPPETSQSGAQKLLGRWTFIYSIGDTYTDTFNLTEVVDIGNGEYVASGENQHGGLIIGGYEPGEGSNKFYVNNSSSSEYTGLDYTFQFDFVSANRVEGYMYFYNNFARKYSDNYPFSGVRD